MRLLGLFLFGCSGLGEDHLDERPEPEQVERDEDAEGADVRAEDARVVAYARARKLVFDSEARVRVNRRDESRKFARVVFTRSRLESLILNEKTNPRVSSSSSSSSSHLFSVFFLSRKRARSLGEEDKARALMMRPRARRARARKSDAGGNLDPSSRRSATRGRRRPRRATIIRA